jgi:hypothetical protein
MKKLIFTLLLLVTVNLNAVVVSHYPHSTRRVPVDNSLQAPLTRKDYHFRCKKCGRDFVIYNMLYHENTDMYFCYMSDGYGLKVLQPFEGRKICGSCGDKQRLTIVGFILIIALLGWFVIYYFDRD